MSTQTIDYEALAKQAGAISSAAPQASGDIDYEALAKQAGAVSSEPATAPQARPVDTSLRSPDRAVPVTAADLQPKPTAAEKPYNPPMPAWYADEEAHQMELATPTVLGTEGYPKMAGGGRKIASTLRPNSTAPQTIAPENDPMGYGRAAAGEQAPVEVIPGQDRELMHGATEIGQGAMEASAPLIAAGTVINPMGTLKGLGKAYLASKGAELGTKALGAPEDVQEFAGTVAPLGAGFIEGPKIARNPVEGLPAPVNRWLDTRRINADVKAKTGMADNLAAALEMGGRIDKTTRTHEDVALPIVDTVRAVAARDGLTPDKLVGREGYRLIEQNAKAVRQEYDDAYSAILDPVRNTPATPFARQAAAETLHKMAGDARLVDELTRLDAEDAAAGKVGNNVRQLQNLVDKIDSARTLGELDDMRIALNRLSSRYMSKGEAQQYQSPILQEALAEGANSIRNALYPEVGRLNRLSEDQIRTLQNEHGAAIKYDNMMQRTATLLSGASSEAGAPPTFWQRMRGGAAPLEVAGRPKMALTAALRNTLLKPVDPTELFNTRMKRVLEGATGDENATINIPRPTVQEGQYVGDTDYKTKPKGLLEPPPEELGKVVPRSPITIPELNAAPEQAQLGTSEAPPNGGLPRGPQARPGQQALPPALVSESLPYNAGQGGQPIDITNEGQAARQVPGGVRVGQHGVNWRGPGTEPVFVGNPRGMTTIDLPNGGGVLMRPHLLGPPPVIAPPTASEAAPPALGVTPKIEEPVPAPPVQPKVKAPKVSPYLRQPRKIED